MIFPTCLRAPKRQATRRFRAGASRRRETGTHFSGRLEPRRVLVPSATYLSIRRLLRPTRRRVLEFLLPSVGSCVEQEAGVGQQLGAAPIGRIGVEYVIIEREKDAEPVLLAEQIVRAVVRLVFRKRAIIVFGRPN